MKIYSKINKNSMKLNADSYKLKDYIFYPRNSDIHNRPKLASSKSALNIYDKKENNKSLINNYNWKLNSKGKVFNNKMFTPIYFYRKAQNPYKYNITSIPEYLIKANQEKNMIDKLELNLKDEENQKIFNEFLNKEKASKIKDRYKPKGLDAQNILRYKPNFYSINSDKFIRNSNSETNIHFIKEKENILNNDDIKTKINNNRNYILEQEISKKEQITDIFNIKDKNPEDKYILRNRNRRINLPNKSRSEWVPNKEFGTKMNFFSSVSYNILSPMYKGFNRFITPTELNKNNLYNESPAFHKVKSISEYIDLIKAKS